MSTKKFGFEPVVFAILLIFSLFLMFHTFGYDGKTKTILIASKLWSDFGSHIPLMRSFSMGLNFPPQYPIFPGEPIRYHFLFYALVAVLEKAGLRLDWALNLPSAIGFFLLLLGIFRLSYHLFHSYPVSVLSLLFFLFNGSLSFLKFFMRQPLHFRDFPSFGPWDGGTITAFWNLNIYTNQRHLALAFAIVLLFIRWVVKKTLNLWSAILWGLIIGLFPWFHQPTLLIFAVLLAWYFLIFPSLRKTLFISAFTAILVIVPQLWFLRASTFHFSLFTFQSLWYPGYLIHDRLTLQTFFSFWFQNLGLHALLIPLGFFLLPRRAQKALVPLFLIFIVGNLFKFSPEAAANHKLFNFAALLGNMITAYLIIRLKVPILVGILILSGVIDFFVIVNDAKGALADVGNNEAATWIAKNTPKDTIFLNSSFLYHPASLAGRKIFLGWPYFPWSAGYDTNARMTEMKTLYESRDPKVFCPILEKHHISYITTEDTKNDPNLPRIDMDYYTRFTPSFTDTNQSIRIFSAATLCP